MIESGNENVNWRLCFARERGKKKVMQYINTVVFWHDIPSDNLHALTKYTTKTHTEKILKTDLLLFY